MYTIHVIGTPVRVYVYFFNLKILAWIEGSASPTGLMHNTHTHLPEPICFWLKPWSVYFTNSGLLLVVVVALFDCLGFAYLYGFLFQMHKWCLVGWLDLSRYNKFKKKSYRPIHWKSKNEIKTSKQPKIESKKKNEIDLLDTEIII